MKKKSSIKVVGIGGGGSNMVSFLMEKKIPGVEFIALNSDVQDLRTKKADRKIQIGYELTKGLGTGMNPHLGQRCAEVSQDKIKEALDGSDIVFLVLGAGGGTGTGAAPVIAELINKKSLVIAVATTPFSFEGGVRKRVAYNGLKKLEERVNALLVISNSRLLEVAGDQASLEEAFQLGNDVLWKAVTGISDLITSSGFVNLDFASLKSFMENAGLVLFGVGTGRGPSRINLSIYQAFHSPLLAIPVKKAQGALLNIASGGDLKINEFQKAIQVVSESLRPGAELVFGTSVDPSLGKGWVRVTVIVSGLRSILDNK